MPGQIPTRFVGATPQAVSDIYDKLNNLESRLANLSAAPSTTTTAPANATSTVVNITNASGQAAAPQFALIPVLTVLPSNNPTQGAPYAQDQLMIDVNNQFWIYIGGPAYQWQQVGTATVLLSDTAANLHNYSAVTYPGALFFETDTLVLLRSNGTNWIAITGGVDESAITKAEWLTVGGSANAITGTTATAYVALLPGFTVRIVPTATNTSTVTLNVNGIGGSAVTKNGTTALSGGELTLGHAYTLMWDGTQWQLLGISVAFPASALVLGTDSSGNPVAAVLASGNVFVGSAGNLPVAQAVSGDGTLSNAGVLAIKTVASFTPAIQVGGSATSITFSSTATSVITGAGTGSQVTAVIDVAITGWPAGPVGAVTIGGLPVAAAAGSVGTFAAFSGFVGLTPGVSVIPFLTGTTVTLYTQGATGLVALNPATIANGAVFSLTVGYLSA